MDRDAGRGHRERGGWTVPPVPASSVTQCTACVVQLSGALWCLAGGPSHCQTAHVSPRARAEGGGGRAGEGPAPGLLLPQRARSAKAEEVGWRRGPEGGERQGRGQGAKRKAMAERGVGQQERAWLVCSAPSCSCSCLSSPGLQHVPVESAALLIPGADVPERAGRAA